MTKPQQRLSEVHEIASVGFGATAAAYDRARPSYPPDAVAWLTASLGIGPGRRVVDLAAGTGKLLPEVPLIARTMRSIEVYLAGADGMSWSPWVEAAFMHVHLGTHDDVVDRIRSVSYVAALPPPDQRAVLDEIRAILREHPETAASETVGIPYRADAMYAERLR